MRKDGKDFDYLKLPPSDNYCTPALTEKMNEIAYGCDTRQIAFITFSPPPAATPSLENMMQGTLAIKQNMIEYQPPSEPRYYDYQLVKVLQNGFVAQVFINDIIKKTTALDEQVNGTSRLRSKLTLVRQARDFLYERRKFFHGLERMVDAKKPTYDVALPEIKKAMETVDWFARLYADIDDVLLNKIRRHVP